MAGCTYCAKDGGAENRTTTFDRQSTSRAYELNPTRSRINSGTCLIVAIIIETAKQCMQRKTISHPYCFPALCLQPVKRTDHAATSDVQHMGVNHGRIHARMPQQFLHTADVVARLK